MKKLLAVLSSTMLLSVYGCGSGGGSSDNRGTASEPDLVHGTVVSAGATNTGIEGVAMATIPEMVPGSIRFRREPLQGAEIAIVRRVDNVEVALITTDSAGKFSVELAPGSYLLVPLNEQVGTDLLRATTQVVPIIPGSISKINVEYESAILL